MAALSLVVARDIEVNKVLPIVYLSSFHGEGRGGQVKHTAFKLKHVLLLPTILPLSSRSIHPNAPSIEALGIYRSRKLRAMGPRVKRVS